MSGFIGRSLLRFRRAAERNESAGEVYEVRANLASAYTQTSDIQVLNLIIIRDRIASDYLFATPAVFLDFVGEIGFKKYAFI